MQENVTAGCVSVHYGGGPFGGGVEGGCMYWVSLDYCLCQNVLFVKGMGLGGFNIYQRHEFNAVGCVLGGHLLYAAVSFPLGKNNAKMGGSAPRGGCLITKGVSSQGGLLKGGSAERGGGSSQGGI